jgi:hypothetical protein
VVHAGLVDRRVKVEFAVCTGRPTGNPFCLEGKPSCIPGDALVPDGPPYYVPHLPRQGFLGQRTSAAMGGLSELLKVFRDCAEGGVCGHLPAKQVRMRRTRVQAFLRPAQGIRELQGPGGPGVPEVLFTQPPFREARFVDEVGCNNTRQLEVRTVQPRARDGGAEFVATANITVVLHPGQQPVVLLHASRRGRGVTDPSPFPPPFTFGSSAQRRRYGRGTEPSRWACGEMGSAPWPASVSSVASVMRSAVGCCVRCAAGARATTSGRRLWLAAKQPWRPHHFSQCCWPSHSHADAPSGLSMGYQGPTRCAAAPCQNGALRDRVTRAFHFNERPHSVLW